VILVPSQGRSAKNFVFDIPMTGKPLPYTKTAEYPTQGAYGSSPDIRGGLGLTGLEELRKFVADGGTLITLGDASAVPGEFGITPQVNVSSPARPSMRRVRSSPPRSTSRPTRSSTATPSPPRPCVWASAALLSLPFRDQEQCAHELPRRGRRPCRAG